MVKALKSIFNFDNASWIFVGAVVIILIILAVFYFSRSKNVESFAENWELEFQKGVTDEDQCGDPKEKLFSGIARLNTTFCLPRCLSDDDCPEIPNNNGELERIKCQFGNADKNVLGVCGIHPKLSDRPVEAATGCGNDMSCAKGYRCNIEEKDQNKKPNQWTGECVEDSRSRCSNNHHCDENSICMDGLCRQLCEDNNDCKMNDYVCKGTNKEKHLRGVCMDKDAEQDTVQFCISFKDPIRDVCFNGYKCSNETDGICLKDESAGSGEGSGSGEGGSDAAEGSGDEGFSNYYEYYANKKKTTPKTITKTPSKKPNQNIGGMKPVKKTVSSSILEQTGNKMPANLKEKFYGGYY